MRFAQGHIVWSLSQHYKEMKKRILADTLNYKFMKSAKQLLYNTCIATADIGRERS